MNNYFIEKTKEMGLDLDNKQIADFDFLFNRLVEENKKYNLTSITDEINVTKLHFLDSLPSVKYIKENAHVCDVGSGGGFPALPIKIARPDISMTMIDSVNKKIRYLNDTATLMNMENTVAVHTRVEDIANGKLRETFDVVLSRAVAKLPTLLEYCLPLVKIGGVFIAYKTDVTEELEIAKKALFLLGGKLTEVVDVADAEEDVKRTLVIVTKVSNTPKQYPRGLNKERTDPIL